MSTAASSPFPGGSVLLEADMAVRKVQSRRFLAGVVWKRRHCILRRDSICTFSIYKNAAAAGEVPMDILPIDGATTTLNENQNGKRILHLTSESSGVSITKSLAFDSPEDEAQWTAAIKEIVQRSNKESADAAPHASPPLVAPVAEVSVLPACVEARDPKDSHSVLVEPAVEDPPRSLKPSPSTAASYDSGPAAPTSASKDQNDPLTINEEEILSDALLPESTAEPLMEPTTHGAPRLGATNSMSKDNSLNEPKAPLGLINSVDETPITVLSPNLRAKGEHREASPPPAEGVSSAAAVSLPLSGDVPSADKNAPVMSSKPLRPSIQPSAPRERLVSSAPLGLSTGPAPDRADICHTPALAMPNAGGVVPAPTPTAGTAPMLSKQPETMSARRTTPNNNNTRSRRSPGAETGFTPQRREHDEDRSHLGFGLSLEFGSSVPSLPKPVLTTSVSAAMRTHNSTPNSDRLKQVELSESARRSVLSTEKPVQDSHTTRRGSAGKRNFPISRQELELEIHSLTALNKQLQENLQAQHGVDADKYSATKAQVALLTDELEVTRIRCATLEEQNRILAYERSNAREELIQCKAELQREKIITTSVVTSDRDLLGTKEKDLHNVDLPSTAECQLVLKLEHISASAETAKTEFLERINDLEGLLESKNLEVVRYQRVNQDMKAEVEELRTRHRLSLSASSELEHRISEELQEEMGNETRRMVFLENENKKLKSLLTLRTSEMDDLMKEVDESLIQRTAPQLGSNVASLECPSETEIDTNENAAVSNGWNTLLLEPPKTTNESHVDTLKIDLIKSQQDLTAAEQRIHGLQLENSTLRDSLDGDHDRVEVLERELQELHAGRLNTLLLEPPKTTDEPQVDTFNTDMMKSQQDLTAAEQRINSLQLENSTLRGSLESHRDRVKELERELTEAHTETKHDALHMNAGKVELENKYRMQTAEIAKLNAEVLSALRHSDTQRAIAEKAEADLSELQLKLAGDNRGRHSLQLDMQKRIGEAEIQASEWKRKLAVMEGDLNSEINQLVKKNKELEESVKDLSTTLSAQRKKQMEIEQEARKTSATARERAQQLVLLEERLQEVVSKNERELSRYKDSCEAADSRVDVIRLEVVELRRLCDELELCKRSSVSKHQFEIQDLKSKCEVLERGRENSINQVDALQLEMDTLKNTYTLAAAAQKQKYDEAIDRSKQLEVELAEVKLKLQAALNLIKTSEADAARAAAAEQAAMTLTEEVERLREDVSIALEEKNSAVQTNKILVEELTEQLLIGTRRCEDMDEDAKTLQSYAAEVSSCQEQLDALTLQLDASEAAREEIEELKCMQDNELEDLRQLRDAYDRVKLELQNELTETLNRSEVAESELCKLRSALEEKAAELSATTEDFLHANNERDKFKREVEQLTKEKLHLQHGSEALSETLSQTEMSLKEACETVRDTVGKCEKLERAIAEKDVVNDVLRDQNVTLTNNLQESEFELNSVSAKLLEATRCEEELESQVATLNTECEAKAGELDQLRRQLSTLDSMVESMVDRSEATRAVDEIKQESKNSIDQLESRIDALEKNKNEILGDLDTCIKSVCRCGSTIEALLPVGDFSRRSTSVWADNLGGSYGDGLPSTLVNYLSKLEDHVRILIDNNESLSRAIAETCVYMLRGRNMGYHPSTNKYELDRSIDSSTSDDSMGKDRVPCWDSRERIDELLSHPIEPSSSLSTTWPVFSRSASEGCERILSVQLLEESLAEALSWRTSLDVSVQEYRNNKAHFRKESRRRDQRKMKDKVFHLQELLETEKDDLKKKYELKNAEHMMASQEVLDLSRDKKRLKEKAVLTYSELKSVQDELTECKRLFSQATADLQKTELLLAREKKNRLELELLLRRSNSSARLAASNHIDMGSLSPLESECESSSDIENLRPEQELKAQLASLVRHLLQDRTSPCVDVAKGTQLFSADANRDDDDLPRKLLSAVISQGSREFSTTDSSPSPKLATLRERLKLIK